jgi:hypothetical protein
LIKIIIITTIKIKIYEYRDQFDNIKIKIPNAEDFVHKCYINAAAFSWKNAYLYNRNNIKDAEYQNNLNIIEVNIREIIKKTFRDFVPFDEIFKQIEDNLTENVNQFKDNEEDTDDADIKSVKPVKKNKKDDKIIAIEEDAEDEEEDEEDDEEDEEDAEDDEEDDEDAEEDEDDDEDAEDDEEDAEEDEEDAEEDEEDAEEAEEDAEDDEEDAEDDEDDAEEDADDDEDNEDAEESTETEVINVVKEHEDNKINIIVDTSLTKYNNDEFKEDYKEDTQEISFTKCDKTNIQEKKDTDAVRDEWSNIKAEYNSL